MLNKPTLVKVIKDGKITWVLSNPITKQPIVKDLPKKTK